MSPLDSNGPAPSSSDELQKPLLPIHPTYSLALNWSATEGISVTAESAPLGRRTAVQGLWFAGELGLGRNPTGVEAIASVPTAPVMALIQDWAAVRGR